MKVHNQLGSWTLFQDPPKPPQDAFDNTIVIMEAVLVLEKRLNQVVLDLYALGSIHAEPSICSFLEHQLLKEEANFLKC